MNGSSREELKQISANGLYEKSIIVDPAAGEIVILTPITVGRLRDVERPMRYFSSVMLQFRGRPQAVTFEIEAGSLEETVGKWGILAKEAGQKAMEQMESAVVRSQLQVPSAARIQMN